MEHYTSVLNLSEFASPARPLLNSEPTSAPYDRRRFGPRPKRHLQSANTSGPRLMPRPGCSRSPGRPLSSEAGAAAGTSHSSSLLAPLLDHLRRRDGDHQGGAVEHALHPGLNAQDGKPGDAGHQEVHGDERAPRIEAARSDRRAAEEGRSERGQQEGVARHGIGCSCGPGVQDPAGCGDDARGDEATPAHSSDTDTAQPCHVRSSSHEEDTTPDGHEIEDVEEDGTENQPIVELERDAEQSVHHHPVREPG